MLRSPKFSINRPPPLPAVLVRVTRSKNAMDPEETMKAEYVVESMSAPPAPKMRMRTPGRVRVSGEVTVQWLAEYGLFGAWSSSIRCSPELGSKSVQL